MRLAPVSGTTSATVPSATRSSAGLEVGLGAGGVKRPASRRVRRSAMRSMKVTPTAESSFEG